MKSRRAVAAHIRDPQCSPPRSSARFWFMRRYPAFVCAVALCAVLLSGCARTTVDTLPAPVGPLRFSTADLDGSPADERIFQNAALTLLAVFSTDCGPCAGEMELYGRLTQEREPGEFQIVGIAANHATPPADGTLAAFVEKAGRRFQVLLYRPEMAETFLRDVKKVPVHFWVNREGKTLAAPETGAKTQTALEEDIKTYLGLVLNQEGTAPPEEAGGKTDNPGRTDGN